MVDEEREGRGGEREIYACFDSGAAESETRQRNTTQRRVAVQILHGRCQVEIDSFPFSAK